MRFLAIAVIICSLLSVGHSQEKPISEKSDYDAGIAAHERGHYSIALSIFEPRAKNGDRVAQFCLGSMYENFQIPIPKDKVFSNQNAVKEWYRKEAKEWYEKAAKQNYVPAQNNLGVIHFHRAEKYFRAADKELYNSDRETYDAMSDKFSNNTEIALEWFTEAAVQHNNRIAQYNIGLTERQRAESLEAYKRFGDIILQYLPKNSTNPKHQEFVESMTKLPSDIVKVYEEAAYWFKKAADPEAGDYARAQFELGVMYTTGQGVEKDLSTAVYWYETAANQGYVAAQHELGSMYTYGDGVEKDLIKAMHWFKKAADPKAGDYARAQFKLGVMYEDDKAVEENLTKNERMEKAIYWYKKAADQGYAGAQNNLALMYSKEIKEKESELSERESRILGEKAARLYFQAAQQDLYIAQYNIGFNFEQGANGFPQDNAEAYYWYGLALRDPAQLNQPVSYKNNADKAAKYREQVGNQLDKGKEQRNEIQEQVDNWESKVLSSTGTGFYINENYILTNAHVVIEDGKELAEFRIPYRRVELKAVDQDVDLALLYDERGNSDIARFRSDSVEIRPGERVLSFGYPLSHRLSYEGNRTEGYVSGLSRTITDEFKKYDKLRTGDLFQHTAPIQDGNSGGPILGLTGNVIGVTQTGFNPAYRENIQFAIRFHVIKKFLEKNGIKINSAVEVIEDTTNLNTEANRNKIYERAKRFTVPIVCYKNKEPDPYPVVRMAIDYWK